MNTAESHDSQVTDYIYHYCMYCCVMDKTHQSYKLFCFLVTNH